MARRHALNRAARPRCVFNRLCWFLGESNSQMVSLTDELSQKNEELLRHQEEIAQLLSQIVELQHRVKEVGLLVHVRV